MLQVTNLFLYKIIFMLALLAAENMFLFRLNKKPHFPLRMAICVLCALVFALLFPILDYGAFYSSFMFFSFYILTIFLTKICYDIDWRSCMFCTIAGYSVQHLASVCYDMIMTLTGFQQTSQLYSNDDVSTLSPMHLLILVQVYALVYLCLYFLYGRKIKRNEDVAIKSYTLFVLLIFAALVQIVLNAVVIYRKNINLDLYYYFSASLTNAICTFFVIAMLFGMLLNKTLQNELVVVYQMLHQQHKQFHIAKETIELINMKCHDLKHQIRSIGSTGAIDPETVREIEETITIYDAIAKTGNQALDVILAEKSLYCSQKGIFVSYMIDGEKLSFISDSDIYSLFGNMLDNAIDAVLPLEQDKKVIGITVRSEGELLSINSHNYYNRAITLADGIPITSKNNTDFHGFGIKSIITIVEKYSGHVSFETKNQVFNLNILFPLATGQPTPEGADNE